MHRLFGATAHYLAESYRACVPPRIPKIRAVAAVAVALSVGALAACTPAEGTPEPSYTQTKLFISDGHAIEAMKALLLEFADAEVHAIDTGDYGPLRALSTDEAFEIEQLAIESLRTQKVTVKGEQQDFGFQVLALNNHTLTGAQVTVAFCRDVTGIQFIAIETGENRTPKSRPLQQSLEVVAEFEGDAKRVDSFASWEGGDACTS